MAGIINAGTLYDALWGLPDGQEVLLFSNDLREMSQVPMLSESWFAFQSFHCVVFQFYCRRLVVESEGAPHRAAEF